MAVSKLKIKFLTNKHSFKKKFDGRVNVKDRIEYLRFGTNFEENAIGISYLTSPGLDVDKNILINEVSTDVNRNNCVEDNETIFYSDTYNLYHANFLLSDVFINVNDEEVPQFLRHELKVNNGEVANVQLLNENMEPVSTELWAYYNETANFGNGARYVYTNLNCNVSTKNDNYEIYYVKYSTGSNVVTELLDSKPYYESVSFETVKNSRQFIVSDNDGFYKIDVLFDGMSYSPTPYANSQRFGLKIVNKSVISVNQPKAASSSERWYLRISPGDFKIGNNRYWVPEFYNQQYTPIYPYRKMREKELTRITNKLFHTDIFPISNLGITGFFVDLVLKDKNGKILRAFSSDPNSNVYKTRNGFVTNITYETDKINSISSNSGFIKLEEEMPRGTKLFATYAYEETAYTYEKLSVNPSINPAILGKRVLLYCKPNQLETSIHHLIVEDDGRIVASSETQKYVSLSSSTTSSTLNTIVDTSLESIDYYSGYELEILSGENSGRKVPVVSYNIETKTLTLGCNLLSPLGSGTFYRINKKISGYSTYDAVTNTSYDYYGWEESAAFLDDVKLADVYVIQTVNINDITSYDARIQGGGIIEEQIENTVKMQNESRWFWDIGNFDGEAYPGMAAILVELPRSILKEMDGPFTRDQVKDIVERHMGEGVYPVIQYYDKTTEITKIVPGNQTIYLEWRIINASKYNIYTGNSPDNMLLLKTEPGTRGNTTLSGLENNKTYYIQIEPIVDNIERLRSRIIAVMPFDYSEGVSSIKYGQGYYGRGIYE